MELKAITIKILDQQYNDIMTAIYQHNRIEVIVLTITIVSSICVYICIRY